MYANEKIPLFMLNGNILKIKDFLEGCIKYSLLKRKHDLSFVLDKHTNRFYETFYKKYTLKNKLKK